MDNTGVYLIVDYVITRRGIRRLLEDVGRKQVLRCCFKMLP